VTANVNRLEKMNIILVHGIFDNGKLFNYMVRFLEEAGHRCYVPSLKPADARNGIADLSKKLCDYINESIGENEKFAIIGFSMGCLISRYYLQELNGIDRCLAFYAVSGPHKGSRLAHLYIGKGAVELRPGSEFLRKLKASQLKLAKISLYTYRTPFDLMILPSSNSHWEIAENYVTKAVVHRFMLRDWFVCNHIKQSLMSVVS
jgi:triacylglycerol lipase